jgi:multiple sugar transport system substrate-binding protein
VTREISALCVIVVAACGPGSSTGSTVLTFPISAVGAEAEAVTRQLERFALERPDIEVVRRVTPDAADARHQLFVEWLNGGSGDPDVLQLDVIWTPELAAAGWILPLDRFGPDVSDYFPSTIAANTWRGSIYALPWFVDVGMLYYRSDLVTEPPRTIAELERAAMERTTELGLVYQGARYEGLATVFLEYVGAFGGEILDSRGSVRVDEDEAIRALETMRAQIWERDVVPKDVLSWREEEARFAFQSGRALFMRNWPYAASLLSDPEKSSVAGRFAVAPMPGAEGGAPTAALGGQELAINANTEHPEAAWALIEFLTRPEQMIDRARTVGQYPPRKVLYQNADLEGALAIAPKDAFAIIERARERPATPLYTELSQRLQVSLHRALTGQESPKESLEGAAGEMRKAIASAELERAGENTPRAHGLPRSLLPIAIFFLLAALAGAIGLPAKSREDEERRLGRLFVLPAMLAAFALTIAPLGLTFWESLHVHDLRMPWRGQPFVGIDNYLEALADERFRSAILRTALFVMASVTIESILGLTLALSIRSLTRGRGLARTIALLPWAVPAVVAALIARVIFGGQVEWLADPLFAWIPILLADVWKTTPFLALLLLAALESIDPSLHEAARIDGATRWQELRYVTLPLILPTFGVAILFRSLDAIRVFDLIYVLTGGGPGSATEPIALYAFNVLLEHLRFGYGSALSLIVFAIGFFFALLYLRAIGERT